MLDPGAWVVATKSGDEMALNNPITVTRANNPKSVLLTRIDTAGAMRFVVQEDHVEMCTSSCLQYTVGTLSNHYLILRS